MSEAAPRATPEEQAKANKEFDQSFFDYWADRGLKISGRSCTIHDDVTAALHFDSEVHLIHWCDKASDTMDRFDCSRTRPSLHFCNILNATGRFDCRLLLDSYADATMGALSYDAVPDEDEAECDALRYVTALPSLCFCNTLAGTETLSLTMMAATATISPRPRKQTPQRKLKPITVLKSRMKAGTQRTPLGSRSLPPPLFPLPTSPRHVPVALSFALLTWSSPALHASCRSAAPASTQCCASATVHCPAFIFCFRIMSCGRTLTLWSR